MRIMGPEGSEECKYDVRFFGGYHQRAIVEKIHIRPISVNIHTLQVGKKPFWYRQDWLQS